MVLLSYLEKQKSPSEIPTLLFEVDFVIRSNPINMRAVSLYLSKNKTKSTYQRHVVPRACLCVYTHVSLNMKIRYYDVHLKYF